MPRASTAQHHGTWQLIAFEAALPAGGSVGVITPHMGEHRKHWDKGRPLACLWHILDVELKNELLIVFAEVLEEGARWYAKGGWHLRSRLGCTESYAQNCIIACRRLLSILNHG